MNAYIFLPKHERYDIEMDFYLQMSTSEVRNKVAREFVAKYGMTMTHWCRLWKLCCDEGPQALQDHTIGVSYVERYNASCKAEEDELFAPRDDNAGRRTARELSVKLYNELGEEIPEHLMTV